MFSTRKRLVGTIGRSHASTTYCVSRLHIDRGVTHQGVGFEERHLEHLGDERVVDVGKEQLLVDGQTEFPAAVGIRYVCREVRLVSIAERGTAERASS